MAINVSFFSKDIDNYEQRKKMFYLIDAKLSDRLIYI